MTKLLSVVVSVYNEELALREFYAETGKILKTLPADWDYEFLFVNDEQTFCIRMFRMIKHFFQCSSLDDPSSIHNRNFITDLCNDSKIMGNKNHCCVHFVF